MINCFSCFADWSTVLWKLVAWGSSSEADLCVSSRRNQIHRDWGPSCTVAVLNALDTRNRCRDLDLYTKGLIILQLHTNNLLRLFKFGKVPCFASVKFQCDRMEYRRCPWPELYLIQSCPKSAWILSEVRRTTWQVANHKSFYRNLYKLITCKELYIKLNQIDKVQWKQTIRFAKSDRI